MAKTMGRTDDMLIIKGVNVFPTQIENILITIKDIAPHYMLVITRENYRDSLEIKVELENVELLENYQRLSDLKSQSDQPRHRRRIRPLCAGHPTHQRAHGSHH